MPLKTRRSSVLEHAIIHSQDELDRLIKELDAQEQHELEMSRRFGRKPRRMSGKSAPLLLAKAFQNIQKKY